MHDAARVAAALILALTLLLLAATATELHGRKYRWMAVLLFIGSVGLWDRAHQLSPELGLVLGIAAAQYGFALALRRPVRRRRDARAWAPASRSSRADLPGPSGSPLTAVALPLAFPAWRTRSLRVGRRRRARGRARRWRAWPLALFLRAPCASAAWWATQSLGDFLAAADPRRPGIATFLLKNLPWFAWPALPLVLWTLFTRGRGFNGGLATPGVQLPGMLALVIGVAIAAMSDPRLIVLMPLLLPLSPARRARDRHAEARLLGRARLVRHPHLRPSLAAPLVAVVRRLRAAACRRPSRGSSATPSPGTGPPFHWAAFALSVFLTALWLALVRPARRSNRRARPQLGGGDDVAVGALLDDLAALPRFAAQLPRRSPSRCARRCRAKAASRAATWATRSGRCSTISRTS